MKKLIMICISTAIFSSILFAGQPLTGNVTDFVNCKLMQLNWDITLTDSQIVLVKAKANEYGTKVLNKDSITCQEVLPLATQEYKIALDSILTNEQKAQILQKQNDRENAAKLKYESEK